MFQLAKNAVEYSFAEDKVVSELKDFFDTVEAEFSLWWMVMCCYELLLVFYMFETLVNVISYTNPYIKRIFF